MAIFSNPDQLTEFLANPVQKSRLSDHEFLSQTTVKAARTKQD
jgi:hypothetical protein